MDHITAVELSRLFEGTADRVGLLHSNGRYQSVHLGEHDDPSSCWIREHFLDPTFPAVGIYPHISGKWCVWGCIDIDHGDKGIDGLPIARNCVKVGQLLHLPGYIEKTKSPMCYHVWFFAVGRVLAADMRDALLLVNEVAGADSKEVNPKQSEATAENMGNFVNLPYPAGRWPDVGRYICDSSGALITPADFRHGVVRCMPADIEAAAEKWRQIEAARPKPTPLYTAPTGPMDEGDLTKRLNGLAFRILRDGVLEGNDRSFTLFKLALEARKSDLSPSEVAEVIRMADRRWAHKFYKRADGERQIERMVGQVFR